MPNMFNKNLRTNIIPTMFSRFSQKLYKSMDSDKK